MAYVKGLDRLSAKLNKLQPGMLEAATQVVSQGLMDIREDAQQRAPVESGDLRDSIKVELEESDNRTVGKVIVDVGYGAYVEIGTSDTEAQPFMHPAYVTNKEQIKQAIRDGARAALREVSRT